MKNFSFTYTQSSLLDPLNIQKTFSQLQPEIKKVQHELTLCYETEYASINLAYDAVLLDQMATIVEEKKQYHPTMLIVIGIGGSILGTMAVVQAMYGALYNERCTPHIYFLDTVDSDYNASLLKQAEHALQCGNTILINVISKSGTTTETCINYELFATLLKKYYPNTYQKYVIITTDPNSPLWHNAQQENITVLTVPHKVGGRFSVFSAVGLFPLMYVGIDCLALQEGAKKAVVAALSNELNNNCAALNAILMYLWYQQQYVIHNMFFFSVSLEGLGKWYRQLLAESIGKLYNRQGALVRSGITPIISIGTTDLHSMAQLYFSGQHNTATTFVSVPPHTQVYTYNISLSDLMNATMEGTMKAYQKNNLPYIHYSLPEKSPFYIAEFMQIQMCEIMYLGFLLNINPFDQPQVELYKKETSHILM
jgi:glucose-6-phosphate isomerase